MSSRPMSTRKVERQLRKVGSRLKQLREEITVVDEQLAQLADEAADLGIRALVAEAPGAAIEHRKAEEHLEAMRRHRAHVVAEIAQLELRQDELLDAMR